jgi:hypothetical protein
MKSPDRRRNVVSDWMSFVMSIMDTLTHWSTFSGADERSVKKALPNGHASTCSRGAFLEARKNRALHPDLARSFACFALSAQTTPNSRGSVQSPQTVLVQKVLQ